MGKINGKTKIALKPEKNEFFNSDFCFLLLKVLEKDNSIQVSMLQPLPACFTRRPHLILSPRIEV